MKLNTQGKLTVTFFTLSIVMFLVTYFITNAQAETPIPKPIHSSRVMDLTGTLSGSDIMSLNEISSRIEKEKGTVVMSLLIPKLQDESIEEFSNRVISSWRPGTNGNAILFVISKGDRKMRIEVGNGAQGYVTDAGSRQILSGAKSFFKSGDFLSGISYIYMKLDKMLLVPEALPVAAISKAPNSDSNLPLVLLTMILSVSGLIGSLLYYSHKKSREDALEDAERAAAERREQVRQEIITRQAQREAIRESAIRLSPEIKATRKHPQDMPFIVPEPTAYHSKHVKPIPKSTPKAASRYPASDRRKESRRDDTSDYSPIFPSSSSSSSYDSSSSSSSSSSSWDSGSSSSSYSGGGSSSDY